MPQRKTKVKDNPLISKENSIHDDIDQPPRKINLRPRRSSNQLNQNIRKEKDQISNTNGKKVRFNDKHSYKLDGLTKSTNVKGKSKSKTDKSSPSLSDDISQKSTLTATKTNIETSKVDRNTKSSSKKLSVRNESDEKMDGDEFDFNFENYASITYSNIVEVAPNFAKRVLTKSKEKPCYICSLVLTDKCKFITNNQIQAKKHAASSHLPGLKAWALKVIEIESEEKPVKKMASAKTTSETKVKMFE